MPAAIKLGPLLHIGRCTSDTWSFTVSLRIEGGNATAPPVAITGLHGAQVSPPELAADFDSDLKRGHLWRWPVSVRRTAQEQWVGYRVAAAGAEKVTGLPTHDIEDVAIPAKGLLPRLAFVSCNGLSEPGLKMKNGLTYMWVKLRDRHLSGKTPGPLVPGGFHVLVGGGDQIYADSIFEDGPLARYGDSPWEINANAKVSPTTRRAIQQYYVDLYSERLFSDRQRNVAVRDVLARIPGVFTWDDHEIFDGWGSYPEDLHNSQPFQFAFEGARRSFEAIQLGGEPFPHVIPRVAGTPQIPREHFLQSVVFEEPTCGVEIVLLDLRTGREELTQQGETHQRIMSSAQWTDLKAHLAAQALAAAQGQRIARHLVVIASVPVIHARYPVGEVLAKAARSAYRDDLFDQWESPGHVNERARLVMTLFDHLRAAQRSVTIVSGDVHVASKGRATSTRPEHLPPNYREVSIDQVTSSGIVHPPPGSLQMFGMSLIDLESPGEVQAGIKTELLPMGDATFLPVRNWLAIEPDDPDPNEPLRLRMRWAVEDGAEPPRVVVYPVGPSIPSQ